MLVSPKWQTMWMESQHCSKTSINVPAPSQQAKKLLEDLRASCSSPNKAVQLEALKCWGAWINSQNQEDWKLNTVCYTAARPLLIKKLQPLQRDVDVCKLRFSLMWALLRKVQNIMHLEGPQYVLEVFLQACVNWLSSCAGDGGEEVTDLIFQLLLAVLCKEKISNVRDEEMFQSLSADVFRIGKVFYRLADKFLNVFVHWKKVHNKDAILKLWRHFLEHCEVSREHMAVPVWHKVFKFLAQMCSEKGEPLKERLGMLHGCATTLRSVLSSSKFLDCGNSLLTPCEALLKKLVELCREKCEEFYDVEMFLQGMEVSKVLSVESVAVGGYGLVINVLNLLDEFSLRSLYWGVWCGLVHCYKSLLSNIEDVHLTKTEMNFYRKLRGVAINFELDKKYLGQDCMTQVEEHIRVLKICPCTCPSSGGVETKGEKEVEAEATGTGSCGGVEGPDKVFGQLVPKSDVALGRFPVWKKAKWPRPGVAISFSLANRILKAVDVSCVASLLGDLSRFRFINLRVCDTRIAPRDFSSPEEARVKKWVIVRTFKANVYENAYGKAIAYSGDVERGTDVKSAPKTRSQKRAEEEEKRKELENQRRRTRKSFEIRVQEIVQKNKERKTEKNCKKPPVISSREKRKKVDGEKTQTPERKAKKQKRKEKSPKLENYFKVITKKSGKREEGKRREEEVSWKQRSLRTMMTEGRETGGVRTRSKEKVSGGRVKGKTIEGSPLVKLSPFKEVFHDHEYARMELRDLRALERVVVNKEESEKKTVKVGKRNEVPEKEKKGKRRRVREGMRKSKRLASETCLEPEIEITGEATPGNVESVPERLKKKGGNAVEGEKPEVEESVEKEAEEAESCPQMKNGCEGLESVGEMEGVPESGRAEPEMVIGCEAVESVGKEEAGAEVIERPMSVNEEEEGSGLDWTPRRGKKRLRMMEGLKAVKRLKLEDEQEKLELEVGKENVEEVSPTKEEKSSRGSGMSGMISSRALRMIALIPESTRGQIHWETSPKVEIKKKGPNVDKNSRASKMLALLSENVAREVVEPEEIQILEMKSNVDAAPTPLVRTPTSSLKSPKTVKQRRSIRFDDTKNETVVYETDTPPSQVLEGKERWRRIQLPEADLPIHTIP